jgi:hypothetical protein
MRPQTDLQPQRQLHLVARVTEALDCVGNLRRVFYRFVDRRSYFLDYLFGCVVNIQMLIRLCWLERGRLVSLSVAALCYASSTLPVNRVLGDDFRFFHL